MLRSYSVASYRVDAVLKDLAERVSEVLGLAGSGVSLMQDGRLTYATSVPERFSTLERAQQDTQAGPCVQACRTGEIVAVPDLSVHTETWSADCAAVHDAGVRAVAGIPRCLEDMAVGALNRYAAEPREWLPKT